MGECAGDTPLSFSLLHFDAHHVHLICDEFLGGTRNVSRSWRTAEVSDKNNDTHRVHIGDFARGIDADQAGPCTKDGSW